MLKIKEISDDRNNFDYFGAYISLLYRIDELQFIHKKKFGLVPKEVQIEKLLEEVEEFKLADKKNQIEELMDIIISAVGVANSMKLNLTEELKKKLLKIARRSYKDNYQHDED